MNSINRYSNMITSEGMITFSPGYIEIDETDRAYFNERIKFLSDEDNLKIYEKINFYDEKYRNYAGGVIYIYNLYLSEYTLLRDNAMASIYLSLERKDGLFIADEAGILVYYDNNDFKNKFETELLGYFAFMMHLLEREDDSKLDIKDLTDITESTMDLSNIPKTVLKPFNKESILFQNSCEIDWGEKKVTKKDIKKRADYITNRIKLANQELRDDVEGQIVKGNYKKERTIGFSLPVDYDSIMTRIKKKIYKN
jgi:hypothetical protein